jgi:ABC-2 type transport system permease protein
MWERIKRILIKEFIQIFRNPRMRPMVLFMPVFQVVIFGYAVTTDVRHVPIGVYDQDRTVASREVLSRFTHSGYFDQAAWLEREEEVADLIDHGRIQLLLRFNRGFEEALKAGRPAPLQIIVDGSDSNTAAVILGYVNKITSQLAEELLVERQERLFGRGAAGGRVVLESRAWFNENLESRNFYVPGVIALLVMLMALLLTSMAVVREKEMGTMEQIMVTPIKPLEFILGKTLPFALISFFDVFLITGVAVYWFDVPIRGNLLLLFLGTGLYLLTLLGAGLFISTVSQTQQQAMMSAFFFNFPAVLLSGFVFPIANMPEAVQWLTFGNPLRYFLIIIRGIFLKGVGLEVLWPPLAALAALGVIVLWFASRRFRKTMA